MKLFLVSIVIAISVFIWIGSSDDGLTTRERHDKEYAENMANEKEYSLQCYQGNKRACKIVVYSSQQIEKYRITYPGK